MILTHESGPHGDQFDGKKRRPKNIVVLSLKKKNS
jgi:hypothetical protein